MKALSDEQRAVVDAPTGPLSVIACAGSGKTRTAVHRLVEMRRRLGEQRVRVALLSFSNVAVDTFRDSYRQLAQTLPATAGRDRVDIDTLDAFITTHVLRPHAHRTMGAMQTAYLVSGSEPFLAGFTFRTEQFPQNITMMHVGFRNGDFHFFYSVHSQSVGLNTSVALNLIERLGRAGAYTHDLGRYWCYRTLREQPSILRALVRRYPHVLIDESQDIGPCHQAILDLLADAGMEISLIGDPNQGIYEFSGADGRFLTEYGNRSGVNSFSLTKNYRCVPEIVALANQLSNRNDTYDREEPDAVHGAFFTSYQPKDRDRLIETFEATVAAAGLDASRCAILCRAVKLADELSGADTPVGRGLVKEFALASILRDKRRDYKRSFEALARCIVSLLDDPAEHLLAALLSPAKYPEMRLLRRHLWLFVRDPDKGLPPSTLLADTEWLPLLLDRVRQLLAALQGEFGLTPVNGLGTKLTRRDLPHASLVAAADLGTQRNIRIRVDTVHKAKGESLDAVLYMATREHIVAMLDGVATEVGRIGYVAVTRARNLLWLGVPAAALPGLRQRLLDFGFREIGAA
jgi:superfamily I DNA/RNA helicase